MNSTTRNRRTLLALGLALGLATPTLAEEITWRTDYNRARQEATEQGRPIVIDFTTDNCHWCRQLESRTFVDKEVSETLNAKCIPLRIDASKNPALAQALNIQTYPTLVYAASDGKILGYHEGFLEAPKMREHLTKLVNAVADPEWMVRDFRDALQAESVADHPRAVSLLRHILEDDKDRPIQKKARKLLEEVEGQAAGKLKEGQELIGQGKQTEAYEVVRGVVRNYRGTLAAREGDQLLVKLASRSDDSNPVLAQRAKGLLAQAREDYRSQQLVSCIDKCEAVVQQYNDFPEAAEARQLLADIRSSPDLARRAAEQMTDRLGTLYLALADGWVQKGDPQTAIFYLEKVASACPNTRHAEVAQVRLAQLQGPKK